MSSVVDRAKAYRENIDKRWQYGIEQIILKCNKYIDCSTLLIHVSEAFLEENYNQDYINKDKLINNYVSESFILRHLTDLRIINFRHNKNITFSFWKTHLQEFITCFGNFYGNIIGLNIRDVSTLWKYISQIASLTIDDVIKNPDIPWNYDELCIHPNIHATDIVTHYELFKKSASIYKNKTLTIHHVLKLGFKNLTATERMYISINPNMTEPVVKKYIDLPIWNWLYLLSNQSLSDNFILINIYNKIDFEYVNNNFYTKVRRFRGRFPMPKFYNIIYNAFYVRRNNISFILNAPKHIQHLLCKLDFYIYNFIDKYPDLPWPTEYKIVHNTLSTHKFNEIATNYTEYYKDLRMRLSSEYRLAIGYITKYIDPYHIFDTNSQYNWLFDTNETLFENPNFTFEYLLKYYKTIYNKIDKLIVIPEEFIKREYDRFIAKQIRKYVAARQIQRAWATAIYDPQYKLCSKIQFARFGNIVASHNKQLT